MSTKLDSKIGTMFSRFACMGSAAWVKLMPFLMFTLLATLNISPASATGSPSANDWSPNRPVVLHASPLSTRILRSLT